LDFLCLFWLRGDNNHHIGPYFGQFVIKFRYFIIKVAFFAYLHTQDGKKE